MWPADPDSAIALRPEGNVLAISTRPLVCAAPDCDNLLKVNRVGRPRKYCSSECRAKGPVKKAANTAPPTPPSESADGRGSPRGGPLYAEFVQAGGLDLLDRMTHDQVAQAFSVERSTVTRWAAKLRDDMHHDRAANDWQMDPEHQAMLAPPPEAFAALRAALFTNRQGGFVTEPFHADWAGLVVDAVAHGRLVSVLSPPRHGKTEMMLHLVIWMIIRDPNIRILWVGRTTGLATDMCRAVLLQLETNEKLRDAFLPPGRTFQPASRSKLPWTANEFVVATRTILEKSHTLKALGAGATLLSRDADLIIGDDLEDDRNTRTSAMREATREWFFKDLVSRKEAHTAIVYIGSRQHPNDLAQALDENPQWQVRAYSAHDPDCTESWDPADDGRSPAYPERHLNCMLWPDRRDFPWLFRKRDEIGNDAVFEMQYLQRVRTSGALTFPRDIVEACRNPSQRFGRTDPRHLLVAGLDPAGGAGYQAAVLQEIDLETNTRTIIDVENRKGGGLAHVREIFERWHTQYMLSTWVVEMNIARHYFYDDADLSFIRQQCGIQIIEHLTGSNKLDRVLGVPGLADHFANGRIVIPWGDDETRQKMAPLVQQLTNFTEAASGSRAQRDRTDLVMALWFPERHIRAMHNTFEPVADVDYLWSPTLYGNTTSYDWASA